MSVFLKNIEFHGILLDSLFDSCHSEKSQSDKIKLINLISNGIINGEIAPIQSTVFDIDSTEQAFRYMASGKHIGKVVIKIKDEILDNSQLCKPFVKLSSTNNIHKISFNAYKTCLIVGGLGGFGLQLLQWMVNRGMKKVLINSRTGIVNQYQRMIVNRVRESGASCIVNRNCLDTKICTINIANCIGTICAIFNLAMVTSDALFHNQSAQTFNLVCKPKVRVTNNLDVLSRRQCHTLDYFVVFSSIVSGKGNAGQTNYGFANSAMERICEKRRRDGLHGLAIQWGAIGDVGIVAETMGGNDVVIAESLPQRIYSCLHELDGMLQSSESVVCSHVRVQRSRPSVGTNKLDFVTKILMALGINDKTKVKPTTTLAEMGMDSLMATEVKHILESECSKSFTNDNLVSLTLQDLTEIKANF